MRLALLGAFPFPSPQGSQVYFAEQAGALRDAGAHVTLVCYGWGEGTPPPDLPLVRAPLAPRSLASGPSPGKLVADAALARALVRAHRGAPFDAVLAHNAEAALAALLARPRIRHPVVYVAHTLLERELQTYLPRHLAPALRRLGARLDRQLARRADAVIVLSRAGERGLSGHARGPLLRIPPGLAPGTPPAEQAVAQACRRHGLEPGCYALYAGNLDGYQELPTLAAAAHGAALPIVVATHAAAAAPPPLRTVRVDDAAEARLLIFGARVALLPRRAAGGFPVKLLNYMEAGRPIVARASIADPLEHGRSGWLLDDAATPDAWVAAIASLRADPALAGRLGAAARRTLLAEHDPGALARRVLELVERARVRTGSSRRADRPVRGAGAATSSR